MFERVMYGKIYLFNGAKICLHIRFCISLRLHETLETSTSRVRIIYAKVKSINDSSYIRSNSNSLNTSCTHQGVVSCQIRLNFRDGCFRSQEERFFTVERGNQCNL